MQHDTHIIKEHIDKTHYRENSLPIYMTSSFSYESAEQARDLFADHIEGNIYSRFSNPNLTDLIEKMVRLEGAETGLTTASGMAATYATFAALLEMNDHVITPNGLFGSTHQLFTRILPKFGITHTYVDINQTETWQHAITKQTKMLFLETPTNPGLDVVDLTYAAKFCKAHNLILVVDNTFSSPILQTPIQYGADIVIHSATKFLDGQGRALGGIILGSEDLLEPIRFFLRQTGPSMSAFNAWLLSKSLETLRLRIERQTENAKTIAEYFQHHPKIENVVYPFLKSHPHYKIAQSQMNGGGSIITFYLASDVNGAFRFLNHLDHIVQTANLGDVKTLITHPFTTTHSKLSEADKRSMNITDSMIRLSVGIEPVEDLINDIEKALTQV